MDHSWVVGHRETARTRAVRAGGVWQWNGPHARFVTVAGSSRLRVLAVVAAAGAAMALATPSTAAAEDPAASDCERWAEARRADTIGRDTAGRATIAGVVRNGDLGTALPAARLEVLGLRAAACADSTGAYRLAGLSPGTVTVRVTHTGFDTLLLLVTVPARGLLRVDIALSPQLVVLDSVRVLAPPPAAGATSISGWQEDGDPWTWRGDPALSDASTGEPDLMRALSADPHLALRPDGPGALMDRGGASDELFVRVDGLPVWNPVHGSGTLSVISPDAIGSITVHDGAMPATFGDRLGGVVDVETRVAPGSGWTGAAAVGPSAMRASWASPLTVGDATGGIRVAFRHSDDDLLVNDAGPLHDHWNDGVATADVTTGATTLRFVLLASGDRALPFAHDPSDAPTSTAIPWSTGTLGLVWTRLLGAETQLQSHVSVARFSIAVPAAADSMGRSLGDDALQTELATQLSSRTVTVGASLDVFDVSYRVADAAVSPTLTTDSRPPPLALASTPTIAAAFAERRWSGGPGDSIWHVTTGLRGMALVGMTVRLEPRVDAAVRVLPGVVAMVGYARTHQAVQSLRNPESPLGAEFGVDLPVAASPGGVPLAQSDVATAGVAARLGAAGRLSLDGYVRALSGLAVADPMQTSPFATTGFARASAHVTGLAAQLDGARGRVRWQAGYGIGRTIESAAGVRYQATSELGQTGSAAVGVAVDRLTQLRLAGWAAFGQRAPGLDGESAGHDDDADADNSPSSSGQAHGLTTPWAASTRLPSYLRADLQLAHQWQTGPARGRLSTFVTLANIFNHANVAGEAPTGVDGSLRGIPLLPRSLLVGISWVH